jgi:hypothetical protein
MTVCVCVTWITVGEYEYVTWTTVTWWPSIPSGVEAVGRILAVSALCKVQHWAWDVSAALPTPTSDPAGFWPATASIDFSKMSEPLALEHHLPRNSHDMGR